MPRPPTRALRRGRDDLQKAVPNADKVRRDDAGGEALRGRGILLRWTKLPDISFIEPGAKKMRGNDGTSGYQGLAKGRSSLARAIVFAGLAFLSACTTADVLVPVPQDQVGYATIDPFKEIRFWADEPAEVYAELEKKRVEKIRAVYGDKLRGKVVPLNYLCISGGGSSGAFGAGFLVGWTAKGDAAAIRWRHRHQHRLDDRPAGVSRTQIRRQAQGSLHDDQHRRRREGPGAARAAGKVERPGRYGSAEEAHRPLPHPADARRNCGGVQEGPPAADRHDQSGVAASDHLEYRRHRGKRTSAGARAGARDHPCLGVDPRRVSSRQRQRHRRRQALQRNACRRRRDAPGVHVSADLQPPGGRQGDRLEAEENRLHHPQQQDRTGIRSGEAKAHQRCRTINRYAHQVGRHRRPLSDLRRSPRETRSATTTYRSLPTSTFKANRHSTRPIWARCSRPATTQPCSPNRGGTSRRACRERTEIPARGHMLSTERVRKRWFVRARILPASRSRCCSSVASCSRVFG